MHPVEVEIFLWKCRFLKAGGFDIGVFGEEALRLRHINPSNSGHKKGRG